MDILIRRPGRVFDGKGWIKVKAVLISDGIITDMYQTRSPDIGSGRDLIEIDASKMTISPCFYDNHMHFLEWSISRNGVDLKECDTISSLLSTLSETVEREHPSLRTAAGELFYLGVNYDCPVDGPFKARLTERLSKAFPDVPVLIKRVCGHIAFANRPAMDLIGSGDKQEDGILREERAMLSVWNIPYDRSALTGYMKMGRSFLHSMGVIGGCEIIPEGELGRFTDCYSEMGGGIDLKLGLIEGTGKKDHYEHGILSEEGPETGMDLKRNPMVCFLKFFMDGSIGAGTASFSEPYSDGTLVKPILSPSQLGDACEESWDMGLIPMIHAIGDRSIDHILDSMQKREGPFRIEHAEGIRADQLEILSGMDCLICSQPNFEMNWGKRGGLYHRMLKERGLMLNPFGAIADSGVRWCFGTDMMPLDPLYAIKGAIRRNSTTFSISEREALSGFTYSSPWKNDLNRNDSNDLGIGKEANMIIFDHGNNLVKCTIIKGRIVHLIEDNDLQINNG